MSIETKLCHVVVAHVKGMLHWCQHAWIEQELAISNLSESSIAQLWYPQNQQNIQMLFPCQLAHFNIWQAHANFFILHFLAQLRTLKPPYCNAILSETRAIRCIYYVYSVFLTVVTIQYTEISYRRRGARVAWWALGNVTTCHIGINAKPFHEPPPHTWALTHYICLALLMQVTLSGSLKFHTPLQCQYKQLLMSLFLSYK